MQIGPGITWFVRGCQSNCVGQCQSYATWCQPKWISIKLRYHCIETSTIWLKLAMVRESWLLEKAGSKWHANCMLDEASQALIQLPESTVLWEDCATHAWCNMNLVDPVLEMKPLSCHGQFILWQQSVVMLAHKYQETINTWPGTGGSGDPWIEKPENLAVFLWQKCKLCTSSLCQCSKLKLMGACVIVLPSPHCYTQKMLFTPVMLFHIISNPPLSFLHSANPRIVFFFIACKTTRVTSCMQGPRVKGHQVKGYM